MSRSLIILALAAVVGAASLTPAAAASKRSNTQLAGQSQTAANNPYRVHRFKTWCTLPLRPYRSNITFALREARGCYRT